MDHELPHLWRSVLGSALVLECKCTLPASVFHVKQTHGAAGVDQAQGETRRVRSEERVAPVDIMPWQCALKGWPQVRTRIEMGGCEVLGPHRALPRRWTTQLPAHLAMGSGVRL